MSKTIHKIIAGIGLSLAAMAFVPGDAQAAGNDYCREYTRTVNIGGQIQNAYGTACLQPNGDWMIVGEGLGNDIPDYANSVNYVIHENRRQVIPQRVVYYDARPAYRNYYRPQPNYIWSNGGHNRNGLFITYGGNKRDRYDWNNGRRYDRHDHHRKDKRDDRRYDRRDRD